MALSRIWTKIICNFCINVSMFLPHRTAKERKSFLFFYPHFSPLNNSSQETIRFLSSQAPRPQYSAKYIPLNFSDRSWHSDMRTSSTLAAPTSTLSYCWNLYPAILNRNHNHSLPRRTGGWANGLISPSPSPPPSKH